MTIAPFFQGVIKKIDEELNILKNKHVNEIPETLAQNNYDLGFIKGLAYSHRIIEDYANRIAVDEDEIDF
jgi:hypothetical protein